MELLRSNNHQPARLDLNELYRLAQGEGKVQLGSYIGEHSAEIKLRDCGDHYLVVKSHRFQTVEQNLSQCIADARRLRGAIDEAVK